MKLVEVCFPDGAAGAREKALAWCAALGKTAVEVPDQAGFVVNRLLFPYLFDAVRLIERTGMEAGEVDTCMKLGAGHPMGPLALLDFVGLDVSEAIGDALYADSGEAASKPPGLMVEMVGEGKLGRKSGAGFYTLRLTRARSSALAACRSCRPGPRSRRPRRCPGGGRCSRSPPRAARPRAARPSGPGRAPRPRL